MQMLTISEAFKQAKQILDEKYPEHDFFISDGDGVCYGAEEWTGEGQGEIPAKHMEPLFRAAKETGNAVSEDESNYIFNLWPLTEAGIARKCGSDDCIRIGKCETGE